MLMNAHYDDTILVVGRLLAIATLLAAPWGIVQTTSSLVRRCLWVMWFLAIVFLAASTSGS